MKSHQQPSGIHKQLNDKIPGSGDHIMERLESIHSELIPGSPAFVKMAALQDELQKCHYVEEDGIWTKVC